MPVQNTFSVQCIIHTHKFSCIHTLVHGPVRASLLRRDGGPTAVRRRSDGEPTAARRRSDGGPTALRRRSDGTADRRIFTGLCAHLCSDATAVRRRPDGGPRAARRRSDGGPTADRRIFRRRECPSRPP